MEETISVAAGRDRQRTDTVCAFYIIRNRQQPLLVAVIIAKKAEVDSTRHRINNKEK